MKHVFLLGCLLFCAGISHVAYACTGVVWVKCANTICSLRKDDDPGTLEAAVAAASDACVGAAVTIYDVTKSGGGVTEIDHYFTVISTPVTNASQLEDDGIVVDHDSVPVKPRAPSGTEWGLAQQLLGSTVTVGYPCTFPCE